MDEKSVQWKQERYNSIISSLKPFLLNVGYEESDLFFVPISGLTGENITEPLDKKVCPWYDGKTMLEILDELPVEYRDPDGPLRIPVLDKMKESNRMVIHGKVESGTVRLGDKLTLAPHNRAAQVLSILDSKSKPVEYARPGENVQVKCLHLEEEDITAGSVLCIREAPMPASVLFEAEIDVLELLEYKPIISKGYTCMIHIHTHSDEITIKDIIWSEEKDPGSGNVVKKEKPKFTRSHSKILCRVSSTRPIPLQKCSEMPSLGRFTLRDEGKTIAVGRVGKYIPLKTASQQEKKVQELGKQLGETKLGAGQPAASTGKDLVFNIETGEVKKEQPKLEGIAEGDEEGDI